MTFIKSAIVACFVLFVLAAPARAEVVNFDDLTPVFDASLASPYAGYQWENFRYYAFDFNNDGTDEFDPGVVSQTNAAYSGGDLFVEGGTVQIVGVISRATPFDFVSAYLGSVWLQAMSLTVQGYLGATQAFSTVVQLDNNGADKFAFNFTNVDRVTLVGTFDPNDPNGNSNVSQFTVDNVEFGTPGSGPGGPSDPAPVPEPATLSLVGLGVAAALGTRRRRG